MEGLIVVICDVCDGVITDEPEVEALTGADRGICRDCADVLAA